MVGIEGDCGNIFYLKMPIRIFNVTLLAQLPPNLDQIFSAHGGYYGTCTL